MATLFLIERPKSGHFGSGQAFRMLADGSREETAIFPLVKDSTFIGRSEYAGLDICLVYQPVNRMHAAIRRQPDGYYIEDLGSRNGTMVNGVSLPREVPQKLGDGDRIGIAGHVLEFRCVDEES